MKRGRVAPSPVVSLIPSGWAIRFDGTRESGEAIAGRLWPGISDNARSQRWAFQKGTTTWSNPDPTRGPLSGDAGDYVTCYGSQHQVVGCIPDAWLGGVSAFTRNILDEWERR
jgi:hypothetical protein